MFKFSLADNEKLIAMHRKSEAVLFKPVIIIFLAIYVPWYFLLKYDLVGTVKTWLLLWTFLVFLYGLYEFLLWLLNTYLITDKRVVAITYQNLFKKEVTESPFDHIGNVGFKTTGIFSSLFNFGDIEIQTFGLNRPIHFTEVKDPSVIKDQLWKLKEQAGGHTITHHTTSINA